MSCGVLTSTQHGNAGNTMMRPEQCTFEHFITLTFGLKEQCHEKSMLFYPARCCFRPKQRSMNWFDMFEILSQRAKFFQTGPHYIYIVYQFSRRIA